MAEEEASEISGVGESGAEKCAEGSSGVIDTYRGVSGLLMGRPCKPILVCPFEGQWQGQMWSDCPRPHSWIVVLARHC